MKRIAVLGVSGRQFAIIWKLVQSENVEKVFFLPGNSSLHLPKVECVDIPFTDKDKLMDFLIQNEIDYIIPDGGEMYSDGIVDFFEAKGFKIFGPSKVASQLESSKAFAKSFMKKHGIPTVDFSVFTEYEQAIRHINSRPEGPVVVKADGLVRGRGVTIAHSRHEAVEAVREIFIDGVFGDAGKEVIIEDYIEGPEVSVHVITDGNTYKILPLAQDHKPRNDGNVGPNTGGMGTYTPLDWVPEKTMIEIENLIVKPTFEGLAKEGVVFKGLLFPGLMLTKNGPMVLEYNARFGAPETQSLMMTLESDIDDLFTAVLDGKLADFEFKWKDGYGATIEIVSGKYPKELHGNDSVIAISDVGFKGQYFFAGATEKDGKLLASGGKIVSVSAFGKTLEEALEDAYRGVSGVYFEDMHYRRDIGRLINIVPERE